MRPGPLPPVMMLVLLAGCASAPVPTLQRAPASTAVEQGPTSPLETVEAPVYERGGPQAVIRRGNGSLINRAAAASPAPSLATAGNGSATFNFEGEALAVVVKAILGDLLGQNYFIAPGVEGTVTLATPRPVSPAQSLNLLEMVLGWNNARMVYNGGRYNIVPADQGLAGTLAPSTAPASAARGYEVRVVPLQYISASEMKKVLEPYARANAIVGVDGTRNLITLAGTRSELENYQRTIDVFDVDWLSGMSVGVFPIQSGRASQIAGDLEKVFGEQGNTPSAGMFRFMPLEAANAVLVITPQARYLEQVQQWLDRIDASGGNARLYSYELRYIKARELADRLAEVFGAGSRGDEGGQPPALAPGADTVQIDERGGTGAASVAVTGPGAGDGREGLALPPRRPGNGAVVLEIEGDRVGVSAVEETNTLLVRASPQAWRSIREVVDKLDVMPMQVHIEAQVAEVALTGDLSYGVNWYFENAVNAPRADGGAGLPSALGRGIWGDLAGHVTGGAGLGWTFLGKNAAAVISALDEVTDVRLLQTPSIFVRNNAEAMLNVGARIPITSVSVNNNGSSDSTYNTVQYVDTGTILKVRPRVTRDGMVFLDIVQEVSQPGEVEDRNGNVRINTRRMRTEAAVQAGDTVMLAGLISDSATNTSSGLPGLSRLPVVGGLFGRKGVASRRSEVIVLLTPTIVRNPQQARELTDEYGQRFRALEPLQPAPRRH